MFIRSTSLYQAATAVWVQSCWVEMTNRKLAERRRQSAVSDGFGAARVRSRCQLATSHLLGKKRDKDKTQNQSKH